MSSSCHFQPIHKFYWLHLQYLSCTFQLRSLSGATTLATSSRLDFRHHLPTLREFPSFYSCPPPIYSLGAAKIRGLKAKSDYVSFLLGNPPSSFLFQSLHAVPFSWNDFCTLCIDKFISSFQFQNKFHLPRGTFHWSSPLKLGPSPHYYPFLSFAVLTTACDHLVFLSICVFS